MLHLFSLFKPHAPRINPCRIEDAALLCGYFSLGTSMWVGIASIAVGAAGTLYGANAQKKANQSAQNANQAQQDKQNDFAWNNWLMTKGIQPNTPLAAGTMPSRGGYSAVNVRLPLWATMKMPSTSTSGKAASAANRVRLTGTAASPSIAGADGQSAEPGKKGRGITLDPLNLMGDRPRTARNLVKTTLDPLGLFG
jgi:hypothetical protein